MQTINNNNDSLSQLLYQSCSEKCLEDLSSASGPSITLLTGSLPATKCCNLEGAGRKPGCTQLLPTWGHSLPGLQQQKYLLIQERQKWAETEKAEDGWKRLGWDISQGELIVRMDLTSKQLFIFIRCEKAAESQIHSKQREVVML